MNPVALFTVILRPIFVAKTNFMRSKFAHYLHVIIHSFDDILERFFQASECINIGWLKA